MSTTIEIKNKLEVKPNGYVQIPGCEPISSLSSLELAKNISCECSQILAEDVLRLIPGSKIVRIPNPQGNIASGYFIELPNGPPPFGNKCPAECLPDWYKILKDNCSSPPEPEDPLCEAIDNFSFCPTLTPPFGF